MKPLTWTKQSWETRILEIDCSRAVPTGATISSVAAAMFDSVPADVSSTMIEGVPSISTTTVYVHVKAGTDGSNYNLRIRLTLSNGEHAEDDITVYVRDIP